MLKLPPVSSERASKGLLPTRQAYNVQPRLQMSTLVSMTEPVLTSKSSGVRYGMVECSAAVSCTARAREREVMGVGRGRGAEIHKNWCAAVVGDHDVA